MNNKKIWFSLSTIIILLGMFFMIKNIQLIESPFNLGIDFTGGTSIIINVKEAQTDYKANNNTLSPEIRKNIIKKINEETKIQGIEHSQITVVDKFYFLVKTSVLTNKNKNQLISSLQKNLGELEVLETDFIGPTIGKELAKQSILIIIVASLLLLIYITFRFEFWAGLSAISALFHDALIVLGLAAILKIEVNIAFVAAILTILGYSINDTIVIFDRIRENFKKTQDSFYETVELSIRQTIVRSINTSVTTLFVLLSIYLFGGSSLKGFALVLLIGIISGTYSSIFIASPIFIFLKSTENNPLKE